MKSGEREECEELKTEEPEHELPYQVYPYPIEPRCPKPDDSAAKVQDTSFSSKSAITVQSI